MGIKQSKTKQCIKCKADISINSTSCNNCIFQQMKKPISKPINISSDKYNDETKQKNSIKKKLNEYVEGKMQYLKVSD